MKKTINSTENYGINRENVDLSDSYNRNQNIIDPLSFKTLLFEIHSNIKEVTPEAIRAQFEADLQNRITSAREVFENNLNNIIEYAKNERE